MSTSHTADCCIDLLDDDEEEASSYTSSSADAAAAVSSAPPCAYGLLRVRRFLPMLVGHADLLTPKAGLDKLRTLTERPGWVRRTLDGVEEETSVHYKYAPMLDAEYSLLGRYDVAERAELPSYSYRGFVTRHEKIMNPMNSAAMDALGAHISGELFRQGLLTAIESFGYRVGLKQKFNYDVGTECMNLCHEWDSQDNAHRFAWCKRPNDYDERKADLLMERQEKEEDEHEVRAAKKHEEHEAPPVCEICGSEDCEGECCDAASGGGGGSSHRSTTCGENQDWWSYEPGEATIDLFRVPCVMVAMERCTGGTLEDLLVERRKAALPFSEEETAALVMQLLFTLAAFQHHFSMVHGDLHMRNIMVAPTELEELHFTFGGVSYAVPTFGRIYKIIDFGRSSFVVDGRTFVSDAFMPYGDGYGMYNCGAGEDRRLRTVAPSRSMDAGLLSGPMFEALVGAEFMADWEEEASSLADDDAAAPPNKKKKNTIFDTHTTAVQRAIFSWGLLRPSVPCGGGGAAAAAACFLNDPELAAELTGDEEAEAAEEEDYEADGGGGGGEGGDAAFCRSLEAFEPEWAGQHAVILDNGAPRFDASDLFRANQLVARYVQDAVPAELLRRYLRPETQDYSVE